jgi:hypothetical protein
MDSVEEVSIFARSQVGCPDEQIVLLLRDGHMPIERSQPPYLKTCERRHLLVGKPKRFPVDPVSRVLEEYPRSQTIHIREFHSSLPYGRWLAPGVVQRGSEVVLRSDAFWTRFSRVSSKAAIGKQSAMIKMMTPVLVSYRETASGAVDQRKETING